MGCLTKAFVMALGVAAAIGLTSKFHADRRPAAAPPPRVDLGILPDGSTMLAGHRATGLAAMRIELATLAQRRPQPCVELVPNLKTDYAKIASVARLAKQAGLRCIGVTGVERLPER